jgi:RNAse (barnase) inhibitor barstar
MKEAILKVLLENTDTKGRYIGNGDEPIMIMFKNSEDCDKESFLSQIADEIVRLLDKK